MLGPQPLPRPSIKLSDQGQKLAELLTTVLLVLSGVCLPIKIQL